MDIKNVFTNRKMLAFLAAIFIALVLIAIPSNAIGVLWNVITYSATADIVNATFTVSLNTNEFVNINSFKIYSNNGSSWSDVTNDVITPPGIQIVSSTCSYPINGYGYMAYGYGYNYSGTFPTSWNFMGYAPTYGYAHGYGYGYYGASGPCNITFNALLNVSTTPSGIYTFKAIVIANTTNSGQRAFYSDESSSILIDTGLPYFNSTYTPANGYLTTDTTPSFTFTVYDDLSSTLWCGLYIDGTLEESDSSVANGSLTTLTSSALSVDTYTWYIRCNDSVNNTNTTTARTIEIEEETAGAVGGGTGVIITTPTKADLSLAKTNILCPDNLVEITATTSNQNKVQGLELSLLLNGILVSSETETTDPSGKALFTITQNGTYTINATNAAAEGYKLASTTFSYTTCPVQIQPPPTTDKLKNEADTAINDTIDEINKAKNESKNTTTAEKKLKEAQDAYNAGNYGEAKILAQVALELAKLAPPLTPTAPIEQPIVTPKEEKKPAMFDLGTVGSLLVVGVIVIAVAGAIYYFTRRGKGSGSYKGFGR